MTQPAGIFKWATQHNCKFGIDKFQLLDLTKKLTPHPFLLKKRVPVPWQTFILGNQQIPSKETAKF